MQSFRTVLCRLGGQSLPVDDEEDAIKTADAAGCPHVVLGAPVPAFWDSRSQA